MKTWLKRISISIRTTLESLDLPNFQSSPNTKERNLRPFRMNSFPLNERLGKKLIEGIGLALNDNQID